jgi:hypothetical protein
MKKTLFLIIVLISSCSAIYTQIVKGNILDKITKNPLSSPKGRLERSKIALWAILANRPVCRGGYPAIWLLR